MTSKIVEYLESLNSKPVLTVWEAAWIAEISVGTLYKRWKAGTGPASFYIGRARRIRRQDLDKWMAGLVRGSKAS